MLLAQPKAIPLLSVALCLLGLLSCAPAPDAAAPAAAPPTASIDEALVSGPNATFYLVTHPDLRKCAYPLCGGFFAQRVNLGSAICSDGKRQLECRILEFDYAALKLDAATELTLRAAVEQGHALVRATIGKSAPIAGRTFDKLVVAEAWIGRTLLPPTGSFSRVGELPIDCVGCASFQAEPLNSSAANRRYHSLAFDPARFAAPLLSELTADVSSRDQGVLFAGSSSSAGGRVTLNISEAYTPFPDYAPRRGKLGESCGTRGVPADCVDDLFCQRPPAAICGRADGGGVCSSKPALCYLLVATVCGCDGKSYTNECFAHAAGTSVDYDGACH